MCQTLRSEVLDPRWRLTQDGKHAVVPITDLIQGAAKILTLDEKRKEARDTAIERSKEITALRGAISKKDSQIKNLEGQNEQLRDENEHLQAGLGDCELDRSRLRPWATIGRISFYGGLATAAFFGYQELAR